MPEEEIGVVTHYYGNIDVAAIEISSGTLKVGDTIHVVGHTSDFETTVESMQIEHEQVDEVSAGQGVGIRVPEHAREHDKVFKVTE